AVAATADGPAALLAALGLLAVVRRDRAGRAPALGAGAAVLLALAPLVKPNVLGTLAGVGLVEAWRAFGPGPRATSRPRAASGLVLAGAMLALGVLVLELASHGAWLT